MCPLFLVLSFLNPNGRKFRQEAEEASDQPEHVADERAL